MKKPYEKPRLYAESFALTEHIAACAPNPDGAYASFKDGNTCTYTDANLVVFLDAGIGCDMGLFDDPNNPNLDDIGMMCYNAFSTADMLFSS